MKKTLGIDIGTNSLGWGIVQDDEIKDCGVLVFDQGIPVEKGVEAAQSPAAERTAFRAARRLKYRRRLRKYHTLKLLIEHGMCPLTLPELQGWIRKGQFPIDNADFIGWLNSSKEKNPYYFRAQAAVRPLLPMELGRALFHIAIRRGFKSSRKDQSTNEKETGELKQQISALKALLNERNITLGQYLYELFSKDEKIRGKEKCGRVEHYIPEFNKICEVQQIPVELKKKLHDALFIQRPLRSQKHLAGKCPLEKKYTRCLISHPLFERFRMLSFINTIKVRCEGENTFRFLTQEERLTLLPQFLVKTSTFKFEKLKKALIKKFFKKSEPEFNYRDDQTVASSSVTHQLQSILECDDLFTWSRSYTDRHQQKKEMDYQTLFDGVKYFRNDYDEENSAFSSFATERVGLLGDAAAELMKINIPDGYARYSLNAIRRIVPFLEDGLIEPYAVYLAKLPVIMGAEIFNSNKVEVIADFFQCIEDYNWEKENLTGRERTKILPISERFAQLLEDKWHILKVQTEKLYKFQEPSNYQDCSQTGILPRIDLGMIYNPMVQRSLTVLRRLVNYLRKKGKIDEDTEIHIELAREVNDKNSRLAYTEFQRANEKERQKAVQAFAEYNIIPSDEHILRWRLWEEQKHLCLYTGRIIEANEIFCSLENTTVDIEHTVPRSLGGDNSMENLTLCDSDYNRKIKIGKLPVECPNYESSSSGYSSTILANLNAAGLPQALEEAEKTYSILYNKAKSAPLTVRPASRQKMLVQRFKLTYWRNKLKTFEMAKEDIEGFSRRQLAATGVMTRHALQFLKSVYPKVYANNGTITDFARQAWGLQKPYSRKDRTDHIHHAVDAIAIAALDRGTLSKISAAFHEDELNRYDRSVLKIAYPWSTFPADVHSAVEGIFVNHLSRYNEMKQAKKNHVRLAHPCLLSGGTFLNHTKGAGDTVRGALHDLTYYGCIKGKDGKEQFVLRTPFTDVNFKSESDFSKIVDKGVREAVTELMQRFIASGMTFKEAMNQEFRMKTQSGNFDGPVIKKVRIFRMDMKNLLQIKAQTYQSSQPYKQHYHAGTAKGSNFLVALYRSVKVKQGGKRYDYELISLWNWAWEHRQPGYVPPQLQTDKGEFIGFINPGVLALFYKDSPDELKQMKRHDLSRRLYKVTEFSKDGRICFRWHREARAKDDTKKAMEIQWGCAMSSKMPWELQAPLLRLSPGTFQEHTLFEGIDFDLMPDGEVIFKE